MIEMLVDIVCNVARVSFDVARNGGQLLEPLASVALEEEAIHTTSRNAWSSADMINYDAMKVFCVERWLMWSA
jgi:hypothetical protein